MLDSTSVSLGWALIVSRIAHLLRKKEMNQLYLARFLRSGDDSRGLLPGIKIRIEDPPLRIGNSGRGRDRGTSTH